MIPRTPLKKSMHSTSKAAMYSPQLLSTVQKDSEQKELTLVAHSIKKPGERNDPHPYTDQDGDGEMPLRLSNKKSAAVKLGASKDIAHVKSAQQLVALDNKLRGKSEVMDIATRSDYASAKQLKTVN